MLGRPSTSSNGKWAESVVGARLNGRIEMSNDFSLFEPLLR